MKYFSMLSVRAKLIILVLTPLIGLLYFSADVVMTKSKLASEAQRLQATGQLAVHMSNLVHEQQKERGATAVFLGSKGTKFKSELANQREATNEKRQIFTDYEKTFEKTEFDQLFNTKLSSVLENLQKIDALRVSVDALSISAPDAIAYYTKQNARNFDLISYSITFASDAKTAISTSSYVNYLRSKERAGIERAVGANGFAAGSFTSKAMDKFKSLIAVQKTYADIFLSTASAEQREKFNTAMNDASSKEVIRMRDIATKNPLAMGEITGEHWFKTITKKINLLKQVEDALAQDLIKNLANLKETSTSERNTALIISGTILGLTLLISLVLMSELGAFFKTLRDAMVRGAEGDLQSRITGLKVEGEMKKVLEMINTFFDQVDIFIRETASVMAASAKEEYYRKVLTAGFHGQFLSSANAVNTAVEASAKKDGDLKDLMDGLEETIKSVNSLVNETAVITENMKDASASMLSLSKSSVDKSAEVDAAASNSQESTTSVASAVEEMSASISEIASQTSSANTIMEAAQKDVDNVSDIVNKFGTDVENIGNIVDLIQDIAEQINLLALNATIESARAGEAGKGFAVVASEVKSLAGQTAKATEEIATQIGAVQQGSGEIISGIQNISETMTKISKISNGIGASVEEQSDATQEISSNMQKTSQSAGEVKNNIAAIKSSLEETSSSASSVSEMTDKISKNIEQLSSELERVSSVTA
jgi:methyl-accepting chemotaxis protein